MTFRRRPARHGAAVLALLLASFAPTARAQLEQQPTLNVEEADAGPPRVPVLTRPPELLSSEEPDYPAVAKDTGRMGDVVLRITIDAEGQVERLDVVIGEGTTVGDDEAGRALTWAAMGAASNFVFSPAEFDGQAASVAIEYRQTFAFTEQVVQVAPPPSSLPVVNLEGIVREAATKIPLEGVEIEVEFGAGDFHTTQSDAEGRFTFSDVPSGRHRLSLSLTSYEASFVDEDFAAGELTQVVVYLEPRDVNQFETVVRRRRAQKEVAKISLSREEVRRVPGTFGDPLRVIENLPGLARAPFIGGALIVRGANPEDTGVYFDGVEIPQLYHFAGLTSVVNAEFLEDIDFYPGGFGAKYGRATAGIVDVTSRRLKMKSFRGYAEIDLIDSGFFFGGPVKIAQLPTVTFAAAARRSYIDALLPVVLDAVIGEGGQAVIASPIYWDYQTKVEVSPLQGHDVSLFAFGSNDDLRVITQGLGANTSFNLGLQSGFHRLVGKWSWRVKDGLTHTFQPFIGQTGTGVSAVQEGGVEASFGLEFYNWGLRDELTWRVFEGLTLATGLDYRGSTFGVDFNAPIPVEIGSFPRVFSRLEGENQHFGSHGYANATAVWVEAQLEPWQGLLVVPGLRAELTRLSFFADRLPDGTSTPASEVALDNIDPRLAARLTVLPWTTVKGAVGVYRQPPSGQQVNPDLGNPNLDQPRAFQLIAGIEQALTDDINLDVQIYYTHRDLLIQNSSAALNDGDGDGEVDPLFYDNGGRGRTLGAELLLRHELTKNLYGWIAYTLSRTEVDLSENRDRFFLTDVDQTHILTVVAQANLPWAFTVGGRFRVVSGNPTALPLGSVHDIDTQSYNRLGSSPRSSRLPTFHQLDVRVDRKWVFDTFSATTYLDLLNVYNQTNAEQYQSDYRSLELQPIPSLPVIPVVGVSGEF